MKKLLLGKFCFLYFLLVQVNVYSQNIEGCMLSNACNYNSLANTMQDGALCDFSCYGCTDESACNYDAEATEYSGNSEFSEDAAFALWMDIENALWELGLGFEFLEQIDIPSIQCIDVETTLSGAFEQDCDCAIDYSENFYSSTAYLGTGSGTTTLTPWTCGAVALAGNSTGSSTINITYPCSVESGIYTNSNGSGQVNITVPNTMSTFTLFASTGSTSFTVYYNPSTTTIINNTATSGSVNLLETEEGELPCILGCTDSEAFNYNQEAEFDDGNCEAIAEGCMDTNYSEYNQDANTEDNSCSLSWAQAYTVLELELTNSSSINDSLNLNLEIMEMSVDSLESIIIELSIEISQATENIEVHNTVDRLQDINLGWSMIGYTCTESADVVEVLSDYSNEITIVKDDQGLAWIVEYNFNAIGEFEYGKGYQIKTTEVIEDFQFCPNIE